MKKQPDEQLPQNSEEILDGAADGAAAAGEGAEGDYTDYNYVNEDSTLPLPLRFFPSFLRLL